MANRAILIPEQSLTPENILLVTEEPTTGIKVQPVVRGAINEGRLDPSPVANPDAFYDIDVLERTAGNVGSARAGWKDSASSIYRAKAATHIPHYTQWLQYGTTEAERPLRPKALSMQSGELLVVFTTSAGNIRWFTIGVDGIPNALNSAESTQFSASEVVMADVVQMPDGELVMMILGIDATTKDIRLVRKTSRGDTDATIEWHFGPAELATQTFEGGVLTTLPQGFAIEVMNNDRIAMLIKRHGLGNGPGATDIARTFSDDRGSTWADLATASSYAELGYGIGVPTDYFGGVDITRDPETGSLIAICGVSQNNSTVMVGADFEPSVLGLVSDNGDDWTGLVKVSQTLTEGATLVATGTVWDVPFREEGMVEAAVVVGDDGLVKFIGAFHGDSGNLVVAGYFDDLCMLSTRKGSISAKDGAPVIPKGTDIGLGNDNTTCSDAFEGKVLETTGFRNPSRAQIALNRFAVAAGTAGGDLDGGAADYAGPRYIEAVNHKGAIYLFMACEDTTDTQYALGYMILNPWTELWERPGLVTDDAEALLGFPYSSTAAYMACMTPTQAGLTVVNAAASALDETTKGLKIFAGAAASTFGASYAAAGFRPNPILFRFIMSAVSGGDVTTDDIAFRFTASDGTDQIDISIRFDVGAASIRVWDNVAGAQIGADSVIDFTTAGVEVVVYIASNLDIGDIFYRAMNNDPEDDVTIAATGVVGQTPSKNLATVTEVWTAGRHTAVANNSTWMGVWLGRGAAATAIGAAFLWDGIYSWTAVPPLIVEYDTTKEATYDDGLRHGARPPLVRPFGQYYRNGMKLAWKGAAGREGNIWDVISANRFEAENVVKTPVASYWRSEDDSGIVSIVWDAGDGARFNPDAVALFGLNARQFEIQFSNNNFAATLLSREVDVSGADKERHHTEFTGYTIAGADNREVVITGTTAQPMTPHQFRSSDRVVWYLYETVINKTIRIVDNDGYRLILAASAAGGGQGTGYIYPDRIGIDLAGGDLGASGGYRYIRIRFSPQDLYEGYYKLGFGSIGQKLELTVGMHPEWGWNRIDDVPVSQQPLVGGGVRVTNVYDGALQRWSFGWSGLRDRPGHASLATWQGVRDDFMKLIDALQRVLGGEVPVALFPAYEDGRASTPARSFDVIPAAMLGPMNGTQQAYENCRGGDIEGAVRGILSLAPFTFVELP